MMTRFRMMGVAAGALLLAACGSEGGSTEEAVPAMDAPDQQLAEDFSEPDFTHEEGDPWCDMVEYEGEHLDCALVFGDEGVIFFDFTAGAAENEWGEPVSSFAAIATTEDGQRIQEFSGMVGDTPLYPSLQDVDGDGDSDLLVPQEAGNVNVTWQVWLQGENGFAEAGTVNGIEVAPEQGGLIGVPARSSAATWEKSYYRVEDGRLVGAFGTSIDLAADTCSVSDWGGLEQLGLTLDEATARYCGGTTGGGQ